MTDRKWYSTEEIIPCAERNAMRRDKYEVKLCSSMETTADYCPGSQRWFNLHGVNITDLVSHWRPLAAG